VAYTCNRSTQGTEAGGEFKDSLGYLERQINNNPPQNKKASDKYNQTANTSLLT
jgi:hypothetical protein